MSSSVKPAQDQPITVDGPLPLSEELAWSGHVPFGLGPLSGVPNPQCLPCWRGGHTLFWWEGEALDGDWGNESREESQDPSPPAPS